MSTKELILEELDALDERDLSKIYDIIKKLVESKETSSPPSLMRKLKRIKIDAPADFSTNLDLYVSGEKHVQ
jgi:hypothetical protein